MLFRLIALSTLFASVASETPRLKDELTFTSQAMIASVPDPDFNPLNLNVVENEVYMKHGQCTGRIPKFLLCGGVVPLALKVKLTDAVNYPRIFIDRDVNFVDILRMPNNEGVCEYGIDIYLRMQCISIKESQRSGRPQRVTLSEVPAPLPPVPAAEVNI